MRGKILADIIRQEKERKKYQKEEFEMKYDDPKEVSFIDENINLTDFRAITKNILSYKLSKSTLAIYPVLCSQTDYRINKTFQTSQKNISKLSGVSENSVRKGIKELEDVGLLHKEKISEGNRRFYTYKIDFIRESELKENKGKTIYFYTCIIHNGIWAKLKPRSKTLYLAMRATAKQDLEMYEHIDGKNYGDSYQGLDYTEYIQTRKWDVCHLSISKLCRIARVERTNIKGVMDELERYKLIERIDRWTKVYLKPTRFLKY